MALQSQETENKALKHKLDSIRNKNTIGNQIFSELSIEYPDITSITFDGAASLIQDTESITPIPFILLKFKKPISKKDMLKTEQWLKVRLNDKKLKVIFEN